MELLTQEELAPLASKRTELVQELTFVKDRQRELEVALKRLDKVLRLVSDVPSSNGSKPAKPAKRRQTSQARIDQVARVLGASLTPLTSKDIASLMGVSTTTVRNALTQLRADGVVRVVGKRPTHAKGLQPELYSVYSDEKPVTQTT